MVQAEKNVIMLCNPVRVWVNFEPELFFAIQLGRILGLTLNMGYIG